MIQKPQMTDRKSPSGRELGCALAYMRMVERRIDEAIARRDANPMGVVDEIAKENMASLNLAAKQATVRLREAQSRYMATFGIVCARCHVNKLPEGNYHRNKTRRNGWRNTCIVCEKAARK